VITMADNTSNNPPRKSSWKYIGPGIVVAATGVGAGDLVATLVAGANFGYTLLWAAVIGCVVKIALAEAAPGTCPPAAPCSTAGPPWAGGPPPSSSSTS
jgi:hypothetical protein